MSNRVPLWRTLLGDGPARAPLALLVVLASAGVATCSFPEVTLAPGDTTSTGGQSGTSTTSAPGGSGGVGGAAGGTTNGGAGGTSATGGAAGGTTASGGATMTTTTTTDTCPIDEDGDQAISWMCAGGTDCADDDVNTNPDFVGYSATPIQNQTAPNTPLYDRNCDGKVETETPVLSCSLVSCPQGMGFAGDVPCGMTAPLGHCGGIPCAWKAENPAQEKIQKCR